jgi:5'-methylthioinosine phosphorylase
MIGVIGGTGLTEPVFLEDIQTVSVTTPFASEPVHIYRGRLGSTQVAFIARHGRGHKVPPHRINYRANIWALQHVGVRAVIGVNAVGGIHERTGPGALAVPRQIIDYSWGREHTYFADGLDAVTHIDFTNPYAESLRQLLLRSAADVPVWGEGVYACTQGPRLESAAEVRRLQRDGCDMIGMTGMPEAALARELGLAYACLALSVNWAAGLTEEPISMEAIGAVLGTGMASVIAVLCRAIESYGAAD